MLPLGLLALCLSFLLPGHYPPWISFQQQWLAALGVALIGAELTFARRGTATRWPVLAWVMLATAAVPLLQLALRQVVFISDGVLASLYVAAFGLSVVIGASFTGTRREEFLDGLCAVFVAASIASTGLALYQWLRLGSSLYVADLPSNARPFANLAQPNHLATLLAFGVAAILRWYEMRRVGGPVAALGITWFALGMLMTQSRTAWLFVGLVLIASFALHRRAGLRLPKAAVLVGVAVFAFGVILWARISDAMYLSSVTLDHRLTSSGRTLIWPVLIDAVRQAPWFGYGWNQVGLAQQATALAHPSAHHWFTDSHNLFLDLALWNGLPLGLLLSGLLLWWFARQVRTCVDPSRWALLLAVSAVFLHSMVEYPYNYAYFILPVGLMMGALDASGSPELQRLPRKALALPLAFMVAMLGWVGVEYMKVEQAFRQVRFVTAGIGVDKVPVAPVPEVWLLDLPREAHRMMLAEPKTGMSTVELHWMQTVAQRQAIVPFLLRYALAAGLNGEQTQAARTLGMLCKMNLANTCAESRAEWAQLQARFAQLQAISFPPDALAERRPMR